MEKKLWFLIFIALIIGAIAYALIGVNGIMIGLGTLVLGLLIVAVMISKGIIQIQPQPSPSQTSDPPNSGA